MYRRGALPKATIKKVMQTITGTSVGHNVVIDNGTATVKAGFSTADAPQCRIPTVVGHVRHKVRAEGRG